MYDGFDSRPVGPDSAKADWKNNTMQQHAATSASFQLTDEKRTAH
jgi:hypothetical protein